MYEEEDTGMRRRIHEAQRDEVMCVRPCASQYESAWRDSTYVSILLLTTTIICTYPPHHHHCHM
jgi:hypothetical protein